MAEGGSGAALSGDEANVTDFGGGGGEPLSPISESADSEMEVHLQSDYLEEEGRLLKTAEARSREEEERRQVQDEWQERERQRQLLMAQIFQPTISARKVS